MSAPPRRRVEAGWLYFSEHIVPMQATATQKRELRRSFYGGVAAALSIMSDIARATATQPQAEALLDEIHGELERFGRDVQAGRA